MQRVKILIIATFTLFVAQAAVADFAKVNEQADFVALVQGKTLSRPFVKLKVTSDGSISGKGAAWDVSGNWTWVDGYFCRDLNWGGDALGQNCQEVKAYENRIKFTSDKGTGDSAEFRLK